MEHQGAGLSAIWSFNLAPVTRRLAGKGIADAKDLETEFRRFAELWHAHPDLDLAPSAAVDSYWHEFVLDTPRYRTFCKQAFGTYVDHVPDDTGGGMARQFAMTCRLYTQRFSAPARLWEGPGSSMKRGRRAPAS